MRLIDHHGDSVELEWGGPAGRTLVLTVREVEAEGITHVSSAAYALQSDEAEALIAGLELAQRERRDDEATQLDRDRARTRAAWRAAGGS